MQEFRECIANDKLSAMQLPTNCTALTATATDPAMKWFCQGGGVRACTNAHIACTPPAPSSSKGLVVFLPGTYLQPVDYSQIISEFAYHGYHSLGLFYPSAEGQNGCGASRVPSPTDLNCTATERFKVLTGATNGGRTNVTWPDSIINRVAKALVHLGEPWSSHVHAATGEVQWSGVIIAGHSNGADHAGFLSKNFNVSRAMLFAGPNDNIGPRGTDHYYEPAPWLFRNWTSSVPGQRATPPERLFGFGVCGSAQHPADDECWHWHPGWAAMGMTSPWHSADSLAALSDARSFAGLHRLCSSAPLPHGSSPDGYNHMASAADCCMPHFPANSTGGLAGRTLWTNVVLHMLDDPVNAPPNANATNSCACVL